MSQEPPAASPTPRGRSGPALLAAAAALAVGCGGPTETPTPGIDPCEGPPGTLCTVVGTGDQGFNGDGLDARRTWLFMPTATRFDADGRLYFVDYNNLRVRRLTASGAVATVVGDGTHAYAVPGAAATDSPLENPIDLAFDADGALLIAEQHAGRILRVGAAGVIEVIAGDGEWGLTGDGGPATSARLTEPTGLSLGADGTLYLSDSDNGCIRAVSPGGIISTVAGTGEGGFNGDGDAASAQLSFPQRLFAHGASLYLADSYNHRIRLIDLETGRISTVAGDGATALSEEGAPATATSLAYPSGVTLGPDGRVYIADSAHHLVRRIEADGTVTTVAGDGQQGDRGDGGPATEARLAWPADLAFSPEGDLYIADMLNARIRVIYGPIP